MNALYDALRTAAGLNDAETWEKQRTVKVRVEGGLVRDPYDYNDSLLAPAAPGSLAAFYEGAYAVYPSGLVLPMIDVPWFWEGSGDDYRMGTTRQAIKYLRYRRLDPDALTSVPADRVHGHCVRVLGRRLDERDYKLWFARPFPAWTWGVTWGQP